MNQMSLRISYLSDKEGRLNDILNSEPGVGFALWSIQSTVLLRRLQVDQACTGGRNLSQADFNDEYRKWMMSTTRYPTLIARPFAPELKHCKYQPLMSVIMPVYDV